MEEYYNNSGSFDGYFMNMADHPTISSSWRSFDSVTSSSSTSSLSSYASCQRYGRRNAIQLKSHGTNFTVKNGRWVLWVDTLPEEDLNFFKEAFALYDRKGKGVIHSRHLGALLRNLGQNPQEEEISDMLDELTDGKAGPISFPEFITLMAQRRRSSEQYIRDALDVLDKNGHGMVDYKELSKDLSTIGACLKPEEIEEAFSDMNIDENGYLEYDDLVDMVSTKPEVFEEANEKGSKKKKGKESKEYSVSNALHSFFGT